MKRRPRIKYFLNGEEIKPVKTGIYNLTVTHEVNVISVKDVDEKTKDLVYKIQINVP